MDHPEAEDQDIDEAYYGLQEAMSGLQIRGNKEELQDAINKASEILMNKDKYVESSIKGLEEANTNASLVLTDKDALQSEINKALDILIGKMLEVRYLGDVNGDSKVDTSDASFLLKYIAELTDLSEESLEAADVNKDQEQDGKDVTQILRFSADIMDSFND
ncbi:MAG TPA: dockerin type I repeat-containing protein [Candidatus Merdenecus merdavium]|nr:dockerin type I repeat-containing protein [Candidatus Merdenecus merdavium]